MKIELNQPIDQFAHYPIINQYLKDMQMNHHPNQIHHKYSKVYRHKYLQQLYIHSILHMGNQVKLQRLDNVLEHMYHLRIHHHRPIQGFHLSLH